MAIDDPVAFAPPPAFGPFRVLHQIGIGALGPVFRTYEPTRDRLVAVKVFRLDITPEQAQVLADELARASDAGLFHPSIVEPIASGVEGTVAYRAEEYVAAESLDAAIRHYAPASLDKALPLVTQLAGAVDFARTAGVGHGALHLRDVFVTPDEARASGFGVVEALERVGLRAPVRRPYSAPERIAGEAWSTPADVFSLAAITYELLTGRRPAGTGEQLGPLTGDHLQEFGAGMRVVLARAMDEAPSRRYPRALAFASALEAAARGGNAATASAAPSTLGVAGAAAPASASGPRDWTPGPSAGTFDDEDLPLSGVDRHATDGLDGRPGDEAALRRDETAYADIDDERDDDAAHYELARAHESEPERTLFDDEAARTPNIAVAPAPSRLWADEAERPTDAPSSRPRQSAEPRRAESEGGSDVSLIDDGSLGVVIAPAARTPARHDTGRYGHIPPGGDNDPAGAADVASDPERPRPAVLPIAVTLILGLLIGFAAGYWAGGRTPEGPSQAAGGAADPSTASQESTPAPSANDPGAAPAQPYSEQAVAQPPATPPAIPDDGPPPAEAQSTRAGAGDAARATSGRILVS
nr:protein kinase [Acidobacteriota bacterium]